MAPMTLIRASRFAQIPATSGAAADLPVEAFVPVVVELSEDALEVRGGGLMPLTSSQPAKTISWTRIGRKRNV